MLPGAGRLPVPAQLPSGTVTYRLAIKIAM